jgi:hypothetical protein
MEKTRYYVGVANLAGGAGLEDGVRLMGEIELTRDDQVVWIPREAFDIDLPPSMVNETVSYLKQPAIERSRTLAADELSGKGTLAHKQENGVQSTASRSIASDVSPNDSEQSDVFLLTPDDKVLRAIVARGPGNDRYVQVRAKELSGARVITNFRYERGSLRRLLGAGR